MTDRDYVAEIMEARGDLPLPTPVDAVLFLITEMGEYIDATLRQKPEYERNNAKAHTPEEELGDMWHMINVVKHVGESQDGRIGDESDSAPTLTLIALIFSNLAISICDVAYGHAPSVLPEDLIVDLSLIHHNLSADDLHAAAIAKLQRRKPAPDFVTCGCGRYNSVMHYNGKWMCMECYREAMKEGAV